MGNDNNSARMRGKLIDFFVHYGAEGRFDFEDIISLNGTVMSIDEMLDLQGDDTNPNAELAREIIRHAVNQFGIHKDKPLSQIANECEGASWVGKGEPTPESAPQPESETFEDTPEETANEPHPSAEASTAETEAPREPRKQKGAAPIYLKPFFAGVTPTAANHFRTSFAQARNAGGAFFGHHPKPSSNALVGLVRCFDRGISNGVSSIANFMAGMRNMSQASFLSLYALVGCQSFNFITEEQPVFATQQEAYEYAHAAYPKFFETFEGCTPETFGDFDQENLAFIANMEKILERGDAFYEAFITAAHQAEYSGEAIDLRYLWLLISAETGMSDIKAGVGSAEGWAQQLNTTQAADYAKYVNKSRIYNDIKARMETGDASTSEREIVRSIDYVLERFNPSGDRKNFDWNYIERVSAVAEQDRSGKITPEEIVFLNLRSQGISIEVYMEKMLTEHPQLKLTGQPTQNMDSFMQPYLPFHQNHVLGDTGGPMFRELVQDYGHLKLNDYAAVRRALDEIPSTHNRANATKDSLARYFGGRVSNNNPGLMNANMTFAQADASFTDYVTKRSSVAFALYEGFTSDTLTQCSQHPEIAMMVNAQLESRWDRFTQIVENNEFTGVLVDWGVEGLQRVLNGESADGTYPDMHPEEIAATRRDNWRGEGEPPATDFAMNDNFPEAELTAA